MCSSAQITLIVWVSGFFTSDSFVLLQQRNGILYPEIERDLRPPAPPQAEQRPPEVAQFEQQKQETQQSLSFERQPPVQQLLFQNERPPDPPPAIFQNSQNPSLFQQQQQAPSQTFIQDNQRPPDVPPNPQQGLSTNFPSLEQRPLGSDNFGALPQKPPENNFGNSQQRPPENNFGNSQQRPPENNFGNLQQKPPENNFNNLQRPPENNFGDSQQKPPEQSFGHVQQRPPENNFGNFQQRPQEANFNNPTQKPPEPQSSLRQELTPPIALFFDEQSQLFAQPFPSVQQTQTTPTPFVPQNEPLQQQNERPFNSPDEKRSQALVLAPPDAPSSFQPEQRPPEGAQQFDNFSLAPSFGQQEQTNNFQEQTPPAASSFIPQDQGQQSLPLQQEQPPPSVSFLQQELTPPATNAQAPQSLALFQQAPPPTNSFFQPEQKPPDLPTLNLQEQPPVEIFGQDNDLPKSQALVQQQNNSPPQLFFMNMFKKMVFFKMALKDKPESGTNWSSLSQLLPPPNLNEPEKINWSSLSQLGPPGNLNKPEKINWSSISGQKGNKPEIYQTGDFVEYRRDLPGGAEITRQKVLHIDEVDDELKNFIKNIQLQLARNYPNLEENSEFFSKDGAKSSSMQDITLIDLTNQNHLGGI